MIMQHCSRAIILLCLAGLASAVPGMAESVTPRTLQGETTFCGVFERLGESADQRFAGIRSEAEDCWECTESTTDCTPGGQSCRFHVAYMLPDAEDCSIWTSDGGRASYMCDWYVENGGPAEFQEMSRGLDGCGFEKLRPEMVEEGESVKRWRLGPRVTLDLRLADSEFLYVYVLQR